MNDAAPPSKDPKRRASTARRGVRTADLPPADPIGGVESVKLFERAFAGRKSALLAVSGGADSTALLVLAGEWFQTGGAPKIAVATVDHGLREEARAEADAVEALAGRFGLPFARLDGRTAPRDTRIEETARVSRYGALLAHARSIGADAVATAHTLDDQAETVLMRLSAGSGPMGLAAMRHAVRRDGIELLRPFLVVPKARLVATLKARNLGWAEDPMNVDPRFARARLRSARGALEREGMTAERLGVLAFRMARVNAAIEAAIDQAAALHVARKNGVSVIGASAATLPDEIKLRLLGRVIAEIGGVRVKLERLERLADHIVTKSSGANTLAGARIAWDSEGAIKVSSAPPRRERR
ncbi:tRNA lysidine(34) synthetase TilS [Chenggangzhangella methanolivorans]|uniref:tRNA(Ile)-lysidine synthase n=1 Tax=Chenggangzhangella methanolivorans TaxID=1437009 RepID=A0A9E6RAU6_9HYPH|nr:tRNA lysidine(34) synthetase TilS [Chenggangzhangella methanolivorans]QZO01364.1 tRNA lysidine(34) synthetase TilS [Chenggangzhangella methanolivorans]